MNAVKKKKQTQQILKTEKNFCVLLRDVDEYMKNTFHTLSCFCTTTAI